MITVFVLAMMLLIEYITIQSKGKWNERLKEKPWLQIVAAALLGVIPGCLGTFAAVSLYTHKVIGMAALVTTLIATSGDEAFVMFSMIPGEALLIMAIVLGVAIVAGSITMLFIKTKNYQELDEKHIIIHEEDKCVCIEKKTIFQQFKNIIWQRALLLAGGVAVIVLIFTGHLGHTHGAFEFKTHTPEKVDNHDHSGHNHDDDHDHDHHGHDHSSHSSETTDAHAGHNHGEGWGWERITYLLVSLGGIFVIITVPDHFLSEHIWKHVIKKHLLRLFLWTLSAFTLLYFVNGFIDIGSWVESNIYIVLLIAVAIGVVPESGPHIIFIFLFSQGVIPFGIVIANSIVQDGHGAIPLLAESRKSFFIAKAINAVVGLAVGGVMIIVGI